MQAAAAGKVKAVQALLALGANPNATAYNGFTTLIYSAAAGDLSSVLLLLKAGADPNRLGPDNTTALLCAPANMWAARMVG